MSKPAAAADSPNDKPDIQKFALDVRALLWAQATAVYKYVASSNTGIERHLRLRGRCPADEDALALRAAAILQAFAAAATPGTFNPALAAAAAAAAQALARVLAATRDNDDWPAHFMVSGAARLTQRLALVPWVDATHADRVQLNRLLTATSEITTALVAWLLGRCEQDGSFMMLLEAHVQSAWVELDWQADAATALVTALMDGDARWPGLARGAAAQVASCALLVPLSRAHLMVVVCYPRVEPGLFCVVRAKLGRLACALRVLVDRAVTDGYTVLAAKTGSGLRGALVDLCQDVESWAEAPIDVLRLKRRGVAASVNVALAQPTAMGDLDVAGRLGAGEALMQLWKQALRLQEVEHMEEEEEEAEEEAGALAKRGKQPLVMTAPAVAHEVMELLLLRLKPPELTMPQAVARAADGGAARDALSVLLQLHLVSAHVAAPHDSAAHVAGQHGFSAIAAGMLRCWGESLGSSSQAQVPVWVLLTLQLLVHVGDACVPRPGGPVDVPLQQFVQEYTKHAGLSHQGFGWLLPHDRLSLLRTLVDQVLPAVHRLGAQQDHVQHKPQVVCGSSSSTSSSKGVAATARATGGEHCSAAGLMPVMLQLLSILTRDMRVASQVLHKGGLVRMLLDLPSGCRGRDGGALLQPLLRAVILHLLEADPHVKRRDVRLRVRDAYATATKACAQETPRAGKLREGVDEMCRRHDCVPLDDVLSHLHQELRDDARLTTRAALHELVARYIIDPDGTPSMLCSLRPPPHPPQGRQRPPDSDWGSCSSEDEGEEESGSSASGGRSGRDADLDDEDDACTASGCRPALMRRSAMRAVEEMLQAIRTPRSWWDDGSDAASISGGVSASAGGIHQALPPPQQQQQQQQQQKQKQKQQQKLSGHSSTASGVAPAALPGGQPSSVRRSTAVRPEDPSSGPQPPPSPPPPPPPLVPAQLPLLPLSVLAAQVAGLLAALSALAQLFESGSSAAKMLLHMDACLQCPDLQACFPGILLMGVASEATLLPWLMQRALAIAQLPSPAAALPRNLQAAVLAAVGRLIQAVARTAPGLTGLAADSLTRATPLSHAGTSSPASHVLRQPSACDWRVILGPGNGLTPQGGSPTGTQTHALCTQQR